MKRIRFFRIVRGKQTVCSSIFIIQYGKCPLPSKKQYYLYSIRFDSICIQVFYCYSFVYMEQIFFCILHLCHTKAGIDCPYFSIPSYPCSNLHHILLISSLIALSSTSSLPGFLLLNSTILFGCLVTVISAFDTSKRSYPFQSQHISRGR